jgi:hypothetical protein
VAFSWGCDSGNAPSPVPSLEVVMTTAGGIIAQETTREVWSDGRVVVRPDWDPGYTAAAHRLSVRQGGTEQVVHGFSGYNPAVLELAISELNAFRPARARPLAGDVLTVIQLLLAHPP